MVQDLGDRREGRESPFWLRSKTRVLAIIDFEYLFVPPRDCFVAYGVGLAAKLASLGFASSAL